MRIAADIKKNEYMKVRITGSRIHPAGRGPGRADQAADEAHVF